MIWLLVLILIAAVAALGYRQGAVRVAFSFVGILVGALLAVPLGHLVSKILPKFGVKDPILLWALGPVIAFIVISAIFKTAAAPVHQKVDVFFKYRAGDLRLALWERLSRRLGLCLGVLNGVAYSILLAFLCYVPSYATLQLASEQDPAWMRFLNTIGRGMHSSGMDKVARAIDRLPDSTYRVIDLGATIYRNPLTQARLRNYPAYLRFAEMSDFVEMGGDNDFKQAWFRIEPIMSFIKHPRLQIVHNNPELLRDLWNTTKEDVADLRAYLASGLSAKYDPIKIIGRWTFDVPSAITAIRRAKPNISSREMQGLRFYMEAAFGNTRLIARPDNHITITSIPGLALPATAAAAAAAGTPNPQNMQGQWKDLQGRYEITVSGRDLMATVENERLAIKTPGVEMTFNRDY